jgi:hypothetical protein
MRSLHQDADFACDLRATVQGKAWEHDTVRSTLGLRAVAVGKAGNFMSTMLFVRPAEANSAASGGETWCFSAKRCPTTDTPSAPPEQCGAG